ncbi:restriction endonuclease subunit S [Agromyces arachidis]|uniref:restriction endonuclease subunit S n=1 Tax=Agromyces arachidis TaxID=766966 RepID=UPI004056F820
MPVSVTGKAKIQTKDYKKAGAYPIVDQGQAPVAGWTDSLDAVIDAPLPIIVFGDHSRTFKYLDRPFARGADGTQLLRPIDEIDPLFFFYACRAIDLPPRGYNRHFTILKEKEVSYPPDEAVQRSIAALLGRVERALVLQQELAALLEQARAAAMHQLFSRGLRGEAQRETEIGAIPENWDLVPFDSAFEVAKGLVDPREDPYAEMLHLGPDNIEQSSGFVSGCKTAAELGLISGKYLFTPGQIVYSKIRPYLNKVAMPSFPGLCSADMYPLTPDRGFNARYLFHFLLSTGFLDQVVPNQMRTGIPKVNREELSRTCIPRPAREEQDEIASILDALERKIGLHRRKGEVLEQLFKSLLHELMTGDVSVENLNLSALSTTEESAA